jgi:hypothetical protein
LGVGFDQDCVVEEEVFDQVSCPGFGTYKPCDDDEDDDDKDEEEDMKARKTSSAVRAVRGP